MAAHDSFVLTGPNGEHNKHGALRVPWLFDNNRTHYNKATQWTVFAMLAAQEQDNVILRNLFDLLWEVLANMYDQDAARQSEPAWDEPRVH